MYRIEVRSKPNFNDARRAGIANDIRSLGIHTHVAVDVADLYFLDGELDDAGVNTICERLLCDAVVQSYQVDRLSGDPITPSPFDPSTLRQAQGSGLRAGSLHPITPSSVEVTFKPGVTDATADEISRATHELGIAGLHRAATGTRYELTGELDAAQVELIARRLLCNDVIQAYAINSAIEPNLHYATDENTLIETVAIRSAGDDDLMRISRERRLSLNLDEMRAIRDYFVEIKREPTDAEIETLAQTWSEHCVHKTFKARRLTLHRANPSPNRESGEQIDGLLKTYIQKATDEIAAPWVRSRSWTTPASSTLTMNTICRSRSRRTTTRRRSSRSAARTPAWAASSATCSASARARSPTPTCCASARRMPTLPRCRKACCIRAAFKRAWSPACEDYGNKMGIPTVNGAILYDEGYTANPLVFCGCVGIAPRNSSSAQAAGWRSRHRDRRAHGPRWPARRDLLLA